MNTLLSILSLTVFLVFAWAVRWHFREGRIPLGMKVVSALSMLTIFLVQWHLWVMVLLPAGAAVGAVLMLIALALFLWAIAATRRQRLTLAFSLDVPAFVQRTGPYRWIRHPFYAAYVAFWIGCATAAPTVPVVLCAAALIALYIAAYRLEERKFLASALAVDYVEYMRQSGAFLPRLPRRGGTRR
jgi:protein-S-isoprenylcysteine O-methyltransferase Ste14